LNGVKDKIQLEHGIFWFERVGRVDVSSSSSSRTLVKLSCRNHAHGRDFAMKLVYQLTANLVTIRFRSYVCDVCDVCNVCNVCSVCSFVAGNGSFDPRRFVLG
jgi:hypothetical protein